MYPENAQEPADQLLQLIRQFDKFAGHKINLNFNHILIYTVILLENEI